MSAAVTRDTI